MEWEQNNSVIWKTCNNAFPPQVFLFYTFYICFNDFALCVLARRSSCCSSSANGDHREVLKSYSAFNWEPGRPKMTADNEACTGLRSQWMIFSLCSICRHRRRAWVKRRMRARLKPWKLFFLMSSYKFTLKIQESERSFVKSSAF